MMNSGSPFAPGAIVGHYRVLGKLGSGGMGEVYRATDVSLGRDLAIKVLRSDLAENPDRRLRFEREARAASALNHPNIVHIYEIGELDAMLYLAMELVTGRTLSEMILDGPLPWETLLPIARQIVSGIGKAHEAGIIHRDLKPENVMVTEDGYVKILDFGLAKLVERPTEEGSELATLSKRGTTPGTVLGTVGHMSPEQAKGESADHRSDQFSLGTLLYEMAAGKNPFDRPTAVQTLSAVIEADPEPLSWVDSTLPASFCSLVERCLAKEPSERYESTRDLLSELGNLQDVAPPTAAQPSKRHTVGREAILAELREDLDSVRGGRGHLISIAGEAGIGKTTVVEAFLDELAVEAKCIGRGRCSERLAGTEAYLPFLEALEDLYRHGSIARLLKETAPSWYQQLRPDSSDANVQAGTGSQERMKRELSRFLEELSRPCPVVLFLEDLQWSDVSTVDLLAHLADRFDRMRVLILATYRLEELRHTRHPFLEVRSDLQARGACREVTLSFLSRDDIESFVALSFPDNDFPKDLASVIHARTEGSPLFMVDILLYLRDAQVIAERDGRWRLAASVPEIERDLPQSVRGMIERKMDRLEEADRGLMLAASVQGYEFDSAVLAEIVERDPEEVEERLQALEQVHALIELVSEDELPDGTFSVRYRFVHALYQNALFGSLSPRRRVTLSRAVAETLLEHWADKSGALASALAVLFQTAREPGRAAGFYAAAAQNAAMVFAYQEAVVLARRGLELLGSLDESPERSRQELSLLVPLGNALIPTKGYGAPEVGETFARARELCRRAGEEEELFRVLHGLFRFYLVRSDMPEMTDVAAQLMRIAEARNDPELLVPAHRAMGTTRFIEGRLARGREHSEKGVALYDGKYHDAFFRRFGQDEGMACLEYLSWYLQLLGYPEQAGKRNQEALALLERWSHPYLSAHVLHASAVFHQMRREPLVARERSEQIGALAEEHGFTLLGAWSRFFIGRAIAKEGRHREGIALLRNGIDGGRATGAETFLHFLVALLAEAYAEAGETDKGLEAVDEGLDLVPRNGCFWEAELHRLKGELQLAKGDTDAAAETSLQRAIDVARKQESRLLELRAVTSRSRLWKNQGKDDPARQALAEIYGWFTEGFDTPDLIEARALLHQLS